MSDDDLFEVFADLDPDEHAERRAEAEQRWGDTDAWRQSQRNTSRYGTGEWQAIKDEVEQVEAAFAALFADGAPADGAAAMDVAEQHREHVGRWFYDCPPGMHRNLGEMYVVDERFAKHYDDRAPGLAAYVSAAVLANADRQDP